jgi:hypothetical protein
MVTLFKLGRVTQKLAQFLSHLVQECNILTLETKLSKQWKFVKIFLENVAGT